MNFDEYYKNYTDIINYLCEKYISYNIDINNNEEHLLDDIGL